MARSGKASRSGTDKPNERKQSYKSGFGTILQIIVVSFPEIILIPGSRLITREDLRPAAQPYAKQRKIPDHFQRVFPHGWPQAESTSIRKRLPQPRIGLQ